ncbi:MAG: hypothetical protein GC172_13855 [Phycisphaera sp.]|nr:hypothetical protein [Phycisphaera sp.]
MLDPRQAPIEAPAEPPAVRPSAADSADITPAQPPSSTLQELDAGAPVEGTEIWRDPFGELGRASRALEQSTGLKLGFAYTALFQQAFGGAGNPSGAGGDVDLLMKWTLLGRDTKDPGALVVNAEYRHEIGHQPPSVLAGEIGAAIPTTNGFGERPIVVKEAYWSQRLFDGALRFGVGRMDPENLVGGHALQSANLYFLNKAFSGNPSVAYPGSGLAAAVGWRPNEDWYLAAGVANAYGNTTTAEFESLFDEWDLFSFGEAGITPSIDGLGQGRYRVAVWNTAARDRVGEPARDSDYGFNLILDQELGDSLRVFARYGYSDGSLTGIRNLAEAGCALDGLLGARSVTGAAVAFVDTLAADRSNETIGEVFHRWQLSEQSQLTASVQLILDPADNADDDLVGVFSFRFRVAF